MSDEISVVFGRPFDEQIAFFRGKLGRYLPSQTWRDVLREAHDTAFMVAGAAKADLLADLYAAVEKAIADGEGIEVFRERFDEIVQRHGWTGWTGSGSEAGRAWRTRVIYRTNLATAYAAGRLAQLKAFPIWIYKHSGSEHPRLQHKAWDGLTLPATHDFWKTHYPPNGFGCGCRVIGARSKQQAALLGGDPRYDTPPAGWNRRDANGLLPGIDEGWDYQPGGTSHVVAALAKKAKTIQPKLLARHLKSLLTGYSLLQGAVSPDPFIIRGQEAIKRLLDKALPNDPALVPIISLRGKPLRQAIKMGAFDIAIPAFRKWFLAMLRAARPCGGAQLLVDGDARAKEIAHRVASKLPTEWVEQLNQKIGEIKVIVDENVRGFFSTYDSTYKKPLITTDSGSTAEHEWFHAIQRAMPDMDYTFKMIHRSRTAGEQLKERAPGEWAREDKYPDWYFGREYFPRGFSPAANSTGDAREVITMTMQALLATEEGWDINNSAANYSLAKLLEGNDELLALAVGLLLRYKP